MECEQDICDAIVHIIIWRRNTPNTLADKVEQESWLYPKIRFRTAMTDHILNFPMLADKQLQILFTGSSQL